MIRNSLADERWSGALHSARSQEIGNRMNRRAAMMLTLLALAVAAPQRAFAQGNPFFNLLVGTWKLNLAKSTYSPGPPPRSRTQAYQAEGENVRVTFDFIDAQGNQVKGSDVIFDDGKSHPITIVPAFDAESWKQVNESTIWGIRTKAGKVVQTIIGVVSADGKTMTYTTAGVTPNGQQVYDINVYEKQ